MRTLIAIAIVGVLSNVNVSNCQASYMLQTQFSKQNVVATDINGVSAIIIIDITSDNMPDLVGTSCSDDEIFHYENTGDLTFAAKNIIDAESHCATSIVGISLTGSKRVDLASTALIDNTVTVYQNDGNGIYSGSTVIDNIIGSRPVRVISADLNTDNNIDLIVAMRDHGTIMAYYSNGEGIFATSSVVTDQASYVLSLDVTDIDNDDRLDIVSANANSNSIEWYKNVGNGEFIPGSVIDDNILQPNYISAYDLNSDGYDDLIVASTIGSVFGWYRNNDNASFSELLPVSFGAESPASVAHADLDNDSDIDLLYISHDTGEVKMLVNDGSGNFTSQTIGNTGVEADVYNTIGIGDLDLDGDLDIVVADNASGTISVYRNEFIVLSSNQLNKYYSHKNHSFRLFDVYPNPARSHINIKSNELLAIGDVKVFDILGRLVKRDNYNMAPLKHGDGRSITISTLPPGAYLIVVDAVAKTYTRTIVVQK